MQKNARNTSNFIKNVFGPFEEPYNMYYLNHINTDLKNLTKINNKLCYYSCFDDYIKIGDSLVIKEHDFNIEGITGNSNIICYHDNSKINIIKYDGKLISIINIFEIFSITMDDKYIYVLGENDIFQYDTSGEYIRCWYVGYCKFDGNFGNKIIVDKNEIFVLLDIWNCVKMYSNDGKIIRVIGNDCFSYKTSFDVYKNHVYIFDIKNNLIKVFTRNGKLVYYKECVYNYCDNLFIIDDNLYILANKECIYKLKFY